MTQLCRFVDVMFHLVELVGWLQILLVVSHKLFGPNLSALFSTGFCSEWRQEERGELGTWCQVSPSVSLSAI